MACDVESAVLKLPHTLGMEFMSKIRSMLEKSFRPNMSKRDLKAMRSLRLNKDIRILQADKGNCTVVLDESKYKDKLKFPQPPKQFNVFHPVHYGSGVVKQCDSFLGCSGHQERDGNHNQSL
jgi:hypothetical protein